MIRLVRKPEFTWSIWNVTYKKLRKNRTKRGTDDTESTPETEVTSCKLWTTMSTETVLFIFCYCFNL